MDAMKAVNFKLTSNMASLEDEKYTSKYFAPIYMGLVRLWMCVSDDIAVWREGVHKWV